MIKISKRLKLIASLVKDNSSIIDVGCDHAHLPIYLCETLKNVKVYATDINKNPLQIAKENIKKYGFENQIELFIKDGIKELDPSIDTVIISGMGGVLIGDILKEKENLKNVKNLILSPNNEFEVVRKVLNKINYEIEKEYLLTENGITYLIIKAVPGNKKADPFFGTLGNKNLESIYYYTKLLNTNTQILKKLPKKYLFKRIKLRLKNKRIKKFLEYTF